MEKAKPISKTDKEMSFEEAFARLEVIVRQLETGEAEINEALCLFEEGVTLTRLCAEILDKAEERVKILVKGENDLVEQEFDELPGAVSS